MVDKVDEGKQSVEGAEGKSHPDSVPWNEYVGIKESLGKKLDAATQKVQSLEEQIKGAISPDEFSKTKGELEKVKADHQKVSDELKSIKDKSVSEKRDYLRSKGVSEEDLKVMSEEALGATAKVLEHYKPKPDMGGGGGSIGLKGSPLELAREAYSKSR